MDRFNDALAAFDHAMDRAQQMVILYDALYALRKHDPANDDALRSAYIQAVSSFDFFAHELAVTEALHRYTNGIRTRNITISMDIMTIQDPAAQLSEVEARIRQYNSYRAFVDPEKLAQMLSCYCSDPWSKITEYFNRDKPERDRRSVEHLRGQLRTIWKRRNKIAHEADVNPALAGISLWPIDKQDTVLTINFVKQVGDQLPKVICECLSNDDRENGNDGP
jgi:hypothetical protein